LSHFLLTLELTLPYFTFGAAGAADQVTITEVVSTLEAPARADVIDLASLYLFYRCIKRIKQ